METQTLNYNNRDYTSESQSNGDNGEAESPGDIVERLADGG